MEKPASNIVPFAAGAVGREGQPRQTAASTFYDELRNDILMGFLEPGARLVVDQLRARYGVGISPIRDALNRLSTEGIVKREDLKGFRVMELTEQELAEIIETQVWLNEIALRKSMERGDQAWEERVVVAFYRMRKHRRSQSETRYVVNPEREALHRDFHLSLLSACGSRWMIRYCAQLEDLFGRYRRFVMRSDYPGSAPGNVHKNLMDATLGRDVETAVRLLVEHVQNMGANARLHLA
ncbi:MAG: GntR family transcriptional regulator [Alphaproteobacteria bacterium]